MSTVLIVEDDPDMCDLERQALSYRGHVVITAGNGAEALDRLEDSHPCVILLDLMMPVMDGLTFLAERARRGLAIDIPVLCLTASGGEMTSRAIGLGATECLQKPADFRRLMERIAFHCKPTTP